MTKNSTLKNLLRTTAIVGTLFMGSQTWGVALSDNAGADQAAANITVAANGYGAYLAEGGVTVAYTGGGAGMTVGAGGTLVVFLNHEVNTAMTYDDPITLNNNSSVYLISGDAAGAFNWASAAPDATSLAATGVNIYLTGATTLPNMSAMPGTTLNILNSLTLTGAAAGFAGPINISSGRTLTPATWTACGGLSGAGTLNDAGNVLTAINGPISGSVTLTAGNLLAAITGDISGSATVNGAAASSLASIVGNISGTATLVAGTALVLIDGSISGAPTITLDAVTAPAGVNITGSVNMTGGTFTTPDATAVFNVDGDLTVPALALKVGTSTVGGNAVINGNLSGGFGLTTLGDLTVTGTANMGSATAALTVGGNLSVTGVLTPNSEITVGKDLILTAAPGTFSRPLAVAQNFTVPNGVTVTTGNIFAIGGKLTLTGNLTAAAGGKVNVGAGLSGAGNIVLTNAINTTHAFSGDVSAYKGGITLGNAPVVFENVPNVEFATHQNNLTFKKGGTVKSITNSGASTVTAGADGDLVITTYNMTAANATLTPGASKKLTVGTLTQSAGATQALTVGAGGSSVVLPSMTVGTATTHVFNSASTIAKLTPTGDGTGAMDANENMTVTSLDVTDAAIVFDIASGKTLTISAVTGNGNITVNGAGSATIKLPANYTGDVITGGTAKITIK